MASVGQQVLDQLRKYKAQIHMARANTLLSSDGRMRLEDDVRRSMEAYRTVAAKELSLEWSAIRKAFARVERQLAEAEYAARDAWDYRLLHREIEAVQAAVASGQGVAELEERYNAVAASGQRVKLRAWQEAAPSAILSRWPGDRAAGRLARRLANELPDTLSIPDLEAARRAQVVLMRRAVEAYVATEVARAEYYPGVASGTDEFSNLLTGVELSRIGDVEMLGLGRTLSIAAVDPVKVSLN